MRVLLGTRRPACCWHHLNLGGVHPAAGTAPPACCPVRSLPPSHAPPARPHLHAHLHLRSHLQVCAGDGPNTGHRQLCGARHPGAAKPIARVMSTGCCADGSGPASALAGSTAVRSLTRGLPRASSRCAGVAWQGGGRGEDIVPQVGPPHGSIYTTPRLPCLSRNAGSQQAAAPAPGCPATSLELALPLPPLTAAS